MRSTSEDRSIFKTALVAGLGLLLLNSCSSVYYLYQAGKGQLRLLNRSRPVSEVIQDETTSPELRNLLARIPEVKHFGERFGLKPTKNYQEYVDLKQDYVVYVVTVSDELKFNPKIFSFPLVGSFNYIGWFSEEDARSFAEKYKNEGLDTDVRGASAYSTLGWFKDPLLSSMIPTHQGKPTIFAFPELVNVFLHESVHATVYISNQSYFNESLASFVADHLTEAFFKEKNELHSAAYRKYLEQVKYGAEVRSRFAQAYKKLDAIYESSVSDSEKRTQKEKVLTDLKQGLGIQRNLSNASLIQFKTYHSGDGGFEELYVKCGRDIRLFLKTVAKIKEEDFESRQLEDFKSVLKKLF